MCRYILAAPPKPEDKQHKLRMIYGNGLKPQIWTQFVERFNIPHVAEFYGATEGNANIGKILYKMRIESEILDYTTKIIFIVLFLYKTVKTWFQGC
jgi:hypothetical protein